MPETIASDQCAAPQVLLVFTTCPGTELAASLARRLIDARLAACVQVLGPCRSFYEWQGKPAEEDEVPLLIKTTAAAYPALETLLRQLHPYELPELLAVNAVSGLPDYLAWVVRQTTPTAPEAS